MRTTRPLALCVFALFCAGPAVRAEPIYGNDGTEGLGRFEGTFTYAPTDGASATLAIQLTNTSELTNGGFLTAFDFNNPGGKITGATLASSNPHFALMGAPGFADGISAAPFGQFDLGASSTGGQFLGGGNPNHGIPAGGSASFTFALTGSGLDGLTEQSFFDEFSSPPGDEDFRKAFFVARFRGFEDGGSDKVPGEPGGGGGTISLTPEPSTFVLAAASLAGLLGYGWRGARVRRPPGPP